MNTSPIEQFAHVLLFTCPACGRPLASACVDTKRSLEGADAHWYQPHCHCGWTGEVAGVVAIRHWVVDWHGKAPLKEGEAGSCNGHDLAEESRKG